MFPAIAAASRFIIIFFQWNKKDTKADVRLMGMTAI